MFCNTYTEDTDYNPVGISSAFSLETTVFKGQLGELFPGMFDFFFSFKKTRS